MMGQNICYHVGACVIPFNLICKHDHILKKLNLVCENVLCYNVSDAQFPGIAWQWELASKIKLYCADIFRNWTR